MSWNPLAIFKSIDRALDIADQAVPDKDLREELRHELGMVREQTYIAELQTQTVPWADALHKLGRQIISLVTIVGGLVLIYVQPDVDPLQLGALAAPGGIYNWIKGKGR